MGKLFIKALPVEEEIKVGDLFLLNDLHPSGQLRTAYRQGRLPYWDGEGWDNEGDVFYIDPTSKDGAGFVHRHEAKKAQFFLCSRDMHVGDDVYLFKEEELLHMDGKHVTIKASDKLGVLDIKEDLVTVVVRRLHGTGKSGGRFGKEEIFKVLGPVSPKATQVKEGDEFEEDQVEEWWYWLPYGGFFMKTKDHPDMSWTKNAKPFPFEGEGIGYTRMMKIKGPCGQFH